jgi:hypothetical protein
MRRDAVLDRLASHVESAQRSPLRRALTSADGRYRRPDRGTAARPRDRLGPWRPSPGLPGRRARNRGAVSTWGHVAPLGASGIATRSPSSVVIVRRRGSSEITPEQALAAFLVTHAHAKLGNARRDGPFAIAARRGQPLITNEARAIIDAADLPDGARASPERAAVAQARATDRRRAGDRACRDSPGRAVLRIRRCGCTTLA